MDAAVAQRYQHIATLAQAIMQRLAAQAATLNFTAPVTLSAPESAAYWLEKDPASGEYGLTGEWRDASGNKLGSLQFHAGGTFYVEHDILRPHPQRAHCFVEAVHAWGKDADIKAELRLLDIPE